MWRLVVVLGLVGVLVSCGDSVLRRGEDDGTVQRYLLRGVVVRRDETNRVVTIKHGPISNETGKVWMEAMTMEFPVPNEKDFETLAKGRKVWATVYSRESDLEYWIGEVREEGGEVSKPHAPL